MVKETKKYDLSKVCAGSLPEDFSIDNPREFIATFRATYLLKVREAKGFSLEEVAEAISFDVKDLVRVEHGKVSAQDMALLYALCELYQIDYYQILSMFRLVEQKDEGCQYGLAAYHDGNIDKETKRDLVNLVESLKKR